MRTRAGNKASADQHRSLCAARHRGPHAPEGRNGKHSWQPNDSLRLSDSCLINHETTARRRVEVVYHRLKLCEVHTRAVNRRRPAEQSLETTGGYLAKSTLVLKIEFQDRLSHLTSNQVDQSIDVGKLSKLGKSLTPL